MSTGPALVDGKQPVGVLAVYFQLPKDGRSNLEPLFDFTVRALEMVRPGNRIFPQGVRHKERPRDATLGSGLD